MSLPSPRTILHVDMDAFFAAVEQLDQPAYRGRPVVVGADPKNGHGRGVVAACSYEARRYGIHSALPINQAWKRCPHAVFVRPRGWRYAEVSRSVFAILARYSDLVEPLSIDEAFLDVTGSARLFGAGEAIARSIKRAVAEELGMVASVGVAPSKFVAKIASDLEKPDGLVVVPPERVRMFLDPLPVARLWGVGPKTGEQLIRRGIRTIGDIARWPQEGMQRVFGDVGGHLWLLAQGMDARPVTPHSAPRSIGAEVTFERDQVEPGVIRATLLGLSDKVGRRLRRQRYLAGGVTLKYRDAGFATWTRSQQLERPTQVAESLHAVAQALLEKLPDRSRPVRLLGVTATHLIEEEDRPPMQLGLFENDGGEQRTTLARTVDAIHERFGAASLVRATSMERGEDDRERPGCRTANQDGEQTR